MPATPFRPDIACEQHHPSMPVADVQAAVDFYTTKLGFQLGFTWGDPPTLAGVTLGKVQLFLEHGTPNPAGCAVYFVVGKPMRLEKRLAALLRDLAAYKAMSVTSCLEEILLHTCEPLGDGVASPHTAGQLRHIQKLKQKHGIDYDSHGSYRFVERGAPRE